MGIVFGRRKRDILTASLVLSTIAGGELGRAELDEIIAVLMDEIGCVGLTLIGYDFESNLNVVASSYTKVCPEWIEAQVKAVQKAEDQEHLYGIRFDVNEAMVRAYDKCKVDCVTLSIHVGPNHYGYLIADCKKGKKKAIQKELFAWEHHQRDVHYVLYMGLAVLLREVHLIQRITGAYTSETIFSRTAFISHISNMPMGAYIIYISFPEMTVKRDLERKVFLRQMKDILTETFLDTSRVYELEEGAFAGVIGASASERMARDSIISELTQRTKAAGVKPCIIGCGIETEPATLALYCIEELGRKSVAGSIRFLYYNAPADTYIEGIEVAEDKKQTSEKSKADSVEQVEVVEETICDTVSEGVKKTAAKETKGCQEDALLNKEDGTGKNSSCKEIDYSDWRASMNNSRKRRTK